MRDIGYIRSNVEKMYDDGWMDREKKRRYISEEGRKERMKYMHMM